MIREITKLSISKIINQMAEVNVYEGYHFSQTRYRGFPWSMSIIGKVTSKTNKALWTMKNSQKNMLLFDEIVQP